MKNSFTIRLLNYWRNCLADADRVTFDPKDFKDSQEAVGALLSDVANGQISAVKAESLITVYKNIKSGKGKKNKAKSNRARYSQVSNEEEEINYIKVLVCPVIATPIPEHGVGKGEPITPIWIPATLFRDGSLVPISDDPPWIPRILLEPMETYSQTIGQLEECDEFIGANPFPPGAENKARGLTWGDVWRYSNDMLRAVAGRTLENFSNNDFPEWPNSYILIDRPRGSAREVIKFYDQLLLDLEKGRLVLPALLKRYVSLENNEPERLLSEDKEIEKSAEHLGQMIPGFKLSKSQREALHHALAMKDGEILAVNGPPGTGKTRLIQSVVASLWVEAALREGPPPVIVATSATNQAVTNIIDSFGNVNEPATPLSGRWIPDIKSYGLYCPATSVEEEASRFQISKWKDMGFYVERDAEEGDKDDEAANIENKDFVDSAEKHFLDRCRQYAGQPIPDVKSAVEYLHKKLVEVAGEIKSGPGILLRFSRLKNKISSDYISYGGIERRLDDLGRELERCRSLLQSLEHVRHGWLKYKSEKWWVVLFNLFPLLIKLIPGAQKELAERNERYFFNAGLKVECDLADADSIRDFFIRKGDELREKERGFSTAIETAERDKFCLEEAERDRNDWVMRNNLTSEPFHSSELMGSLDTTLRHITFKLATHYWEGRWLVEMKDHLNRPEEYLRKPDEKQFSEQEQKKRWRRYAKLTPCIVVTLYKLEPFFNALDYAASDEESKRIPLYAFIDWLIIDEAGQVAPDIAGTNFSLAKKALVVGDTMQLKPVRGITIGTDIANLKKHSVVESREEVTTIDAAGFNVSEGRIISGGNVMKIAQRASRYRKPDARDEERGMFLTEHHRCAKEIIEYCNELAYKGRLIPLRECELDRTLPRMGYAHIPGAPEKVGSSRRNTVESQVIVRWIEDNQKRLETRYPELPIDKIVAVVTPFRPQAQLIKSELKKRGALGGITVGTVHVLQGAECPVVLFSPVYGAGENPKFLNREPNMLNVAVSRAKDSFLMFGNIGVLCQSREGSPAEMLARYLIAAENSEITDIEIPRRNDMVSSSGVRHLSTLEEHRKALTDNLRNARHKVWITSPFISINAIKRDKLEDLITEAVGRGVSVTIYTDPHFNYKQEGGKKVFNLEFVQGVKHLKQSGANVIPIWFDHSKTLIADDELLIEGSFNWCSAPRYSIGGYLQINRSIEYRGGGLANLIDRLIEQTQSRGCPKNIADEISKW